MRSYANIILLENMLYNVPSQSQYIKTLSQTLFNPVVKITSIACDNRLGLEISSKFLVSDPTNDPYGNPINVIDHVVLLENPLNGFTVPNYTPVTIGGKVLSSIGPKMPVATDVIGHRTMRIRHASTCTAVEGICTLCEYANAIGSTSDFYLNGVLEKHYYESGIDYNQAAKGVGDTIRIRSSLGKTKSFNQPAEKALLTWLAGTYFGALMGVKAFDSYPLPLKATLLRESISTNMLALALSELSANTRIPGNFVQYLNDCEDKLEKAMGIVVTYCVYSQSEVQIPSLSSAPRGEDWILDDV